MMTIKLPYASSEEFQILLKELRRQQTCVIHCSYNLHKQGLDLTQINQNVRTLNNIDKLNSWMLYSASSYARKYPTDKTVIFGGKKNWIDYVNKKITKEEFKQRRLEKFIVIGEALQYGNRCFELDIQNRKVIFKNTRNDHYELIIPTKINDNWLEQLTYIQLKAEIKAEPFMVQLDDKFIHISFTPNLQKHKDLNKNRIFSIDMNPSEIGFSVLEFDKNDKYKVIDSGIIDNSDLNKELKGLASNHPDQIKQNNKRTFEVYETSKFLITNALHYKCDKFVIEDLNITSEDHNKGKKFNRLVNNNWNRAKLESNIEKRCYISGIKLVKVNAYYSSFVGNLVNKNFPDPISSAIEIGRRGYKKFVKAWFYPKLIVFNDLPKQWKQEVSNSYRSWIQLFNEVKKVGLKYHFSWKDFDKKLFQVLSLTSDKSSVRLVTAKKNIIKL